MKKSTTDKSKSHEKLGVKENATPKELESDFKKLGLQPNKLAGSSSAGSSLGNAQEWLDSNYPLNGKCQRKEDKWNHGKKRSEITYLIINNNINLTGELTLTGFTNLTEFYCKNTNLTSLNLNNLSNLTELDCFKNNLTNLNLTNCSNLTELNCSENQLTNLNLTNCSSLTKIKCQGNKLTNLNLTFPFTSLIELDCSNNNLTNADFLARLFNRDELKNLSIGGNNFKSDLTIFSSFTKLENLLININKESSTDNTNSQWTGSLEPLHNLTNLRYLNISNTDINSGLECLPTRLSFFYCDTKLKPHALSKNLIKELEVHGKPDRDNNYIKPLQQWKQANWQVAKIQQK